MNLDYISAEAQSNDLYHLYDNFSMLYSQHWKKSDFSPHLKNKDLEVKSLKKVLKLKKVSKLLTLKLLKLKQRQSYYRYFRDELVKSIKSLFKSLEAPLLRRMKVINSYKSGLKSTQFQIYRDLDSTKSLYYHLIQEVPKQFQDDEDFELFDTEPIKQSLIHALRLPQTQESLSLIHKSGISTINSTLPSFYDLNISSTQHKLDNFQKLIEKLQRKLQKVSSLDSTENSVDGVFLRFTHLPDNKFFNSPSITSDNKQMLYKENNYIIGRDLTPSSSGFKLQLHTEMMFCYDLSPTNRYLVANYGNMLVVWNYLKKTTDFKINLENKRVYLIKITRDEKHFITSSDDGLITIWSIPLKKAISTLSAGPNNNIRYMYLSHNSKYLVTLSREAIVWNLHTNRSECVINSHYGIINYITMTDCNTYLVYSTQCDLVVWNLIKHSEVFRIRTKDNIHHIDTLRNRYVLYTHEHELWIYDIQTQKNQKITESKKTIGSMNTSQDGKLSIMNGRSLCAFCLI